MISATRVASLWLKAGETHLSRTIFQNLLKHPLPGNLKRLIERLLKAYYKHGLEADPNPQVEGVVNKAFDAVKDANISMLSGKEKVKIFNDRDLQAWMVLRGLTEGFPEGIPNEATKPYHELVIEIQGMMGPHIIFPKEIESKVKEVNSLFRSLKSVGTVPEKPVEKKPVEEEAVFEKAPEAPAKAPEAPASPEKRPLPVAVEKMIKDVWKKFTIFQDPRGLLSKLRLRKGLKGFGLSDTWRSIGRLRSNLVRNINPRDWESVLGDLLSEMR